MWNLIYVLALFLADQIEADFAGFFSDTGLVELLTVDLIEFEFDLLLLFYFGGFLSLLAVVDKIYYNSYFSWR